MCYYRSVVDLAPQIERFYKEFPSEQIHVVVFDDLVRDTAATFTDTLQFLGLPSSTDISFGRVNSNKTARSSSLRDMILRSPPLWLRQVAHVVPTTQRHGLMRLLQRVNTRYIDRPPMDPTLRRQLSTVMAPEIDALSRVVGRDLTHWYKNAEDRGHAHTSGVQEQASARSDN